MRTSSMSSGTLLASRAPPPQQQTTPNTPTQPSLLGQLPTNLAQSVSSNLPSQSLLKNVAPIATNNAAKVLNIMPTASILNNHRSTPVQQPQPPPPPPPQQPQSQSATPQPFSTFPFAQRPLQDSKHVNSQRVHTLDSPGLANENEFPSLHMRTSPTSLSNNLFGQTSLPNVPTSTMSMFANKDAFSAINRMPYASLMRVGDGAWCSQANEFSLQMEDFPALPGATGPQQQNSLNAGSTHCQTNQTESHLLSSGHANFGQQHFSTNSNTTDLLSNGTNENGREMKGILTNPDGLVSNIPSGMLCDQYGMAGLLSFLRSLDKHQPPASLCLGLDLTHLGLNLNAPEKNLFQTFGGPWCEIPTRMQEPEPKVPEEYVMSNQVRDKLPQIKVNKLSEDVLFYIFYNCPGQVYQVSAAHELYSRDWRYHKIDGVWLTRSAFGIVKEQTNEYEKGSYNIFDPIQWRKIPKEMTLEYKMLDSKAAIVDSDRPKSSR